MTSAWQNATLRAALDIATTQPAAVAAATTARFISNCKGALGTMMTDGMTGSRIAVVVFGIVSISGATLCAPAPRRRARSNADACAGSHRDDAHFLAHSAGTEPFNRRQPRSRHAVECRPGHWCDVEASGSPIARPADGTTDARGRLSMPRASLSPAADFWVLAVKSPQGGDLGRFFVRLSAGREFNDLWMAWHELPDASPGSPGASGPRPGEPGPPPKIEPPATSDHNGRILVEGIGADRLVLALIEGPGIESQPAIIVTRPGPAIPVKGKGGLIVHGAGFKHVAVRSRAIEGVVRDGKTSQSGRLDPRPRL